MKTQQFTVVDPLGIHARPASQLVAKATPFASSIEIRTEEKAANLKSILGVMGLALKQGSQFTLVVEGEDEEQALAALTTLITEMGLAQ
ncbi:MULTISPECIES: HPr family phosphocarrier protein [Lysinibacillus]|jgi:phosphocarrier protein HPr|uniref:Phosphocarrier protein HPr n=2 Tax=Lysinibacillus TaxID=400634 RepID=A0A2X0Y3P2_9BACI|nr:MULTISPECIES: HPr family phosphocarrier protein [Lysinibacillus]EFI68194.1 phosphocarrier protein HPr [Lysinibacillus fusiformis ZC1]EKU43469.1 phosphocarrier protein HPr [Lysinibacillus fusiformis ZB2]KGR80997.1 phosphocarrier protein HPr [Lysinibacillus boronitolerans JCM 21713 = 10a = NBRC 103108]KMN41914.1 phosphocarrier protein HPr [Lysinibacillus sp. LK3]MBU5251290.1 HPr family phosphocarrier protein [Lysinibacillus capsici]